MNVRACFFYPLHPSPCFYILPFAQMFSLFLSNINHICIFYLQHIYFQFSLFILVSAFVLYFPPLQLQQCFYFLAFPSRSFNRLSLLWIDFVSSTCVFQAHSIISPRPLTLCFWVLSGDISLKCLTSVTVVRHGLKTERCTAQKAIDLESDLLNLAAGCIVSTCSVCVFAQNKHVCKRPKM